VIYLKLLSEQLNMAALCSAWLFGNLLFGNLEALPLTEHRGAPKDKQPRNNRGQIPAPPRK